MPGTHLASWATVIAVAMLAAAPPIRLAGAVAATGPSASASIDALAVDATGDDPFASLVALDQLTRAGDTADAVLRRIVPQILARDAATVLAAAQAAPTDLPKRRTAESEMAGLRKQARETIDHLTGERESLQAARRNYVRLTSAQARVALAYAPALRVTVAIARRDACMKLAHRADVRDANSGSANFEKGAADAVAMPLATAAGYLTGPLVPPVDVEHRGLWLYLSSLRIAAFNRSIEPAMNAAEVAHARRVNAYREMLGLLPLEFEPRLIQSARRHSKEMIDLWYFSHWSPTPSQRSPFGRMADAGYQSGSNENITMGPFLEVEAFWNLFNSPEHHLGWLNPQANAMGVGKWENAWTEDFGAAPRRMTAQPAERPEPGDPEPNLKPQTQVTHTRPRDLSDIKIYDENGQQVGTGKEFGKPQ